MYKITKAPEFTNSGAFAVETARMAWILAIGILVRRDNIVAIGLAMHMIRLGLRHNKRACAAGSGFGRKEPLVE